MDTTHIAELIVQTLDAEGLTAHVLEYDYSDSRYIGATVNGHPEQQFSISVSYTQ